MIDFKKRAEGVLFHLGISRESDTKYLAQALSDAHQAGRREGLLKTAKEWREFYARDLHQIGPVIAFIEALETEAISPAPKNPA